MIFSFPIDAWLLLLVAVGLGLALEVAYYRARRADPAYHAAAANGPDAPPGAGAREVDQGPGES